MQRPAIKRKQVVLASAAIGLSLMLTACRYHLPARHATPPILLNVPFYPQEEGFCGDAALAMVIHYHDQEPDRQALKERVHVPALNGTVPDLILQAAGELNFNSIARTNATLEELSEQLASQSPPIIYFGPEYGSDIGHFLVVNGIDHSRKRIRVHSGKDQNRWFRFAHFEQKWNRGHHLFIAIQPQATKIPNKQRLILSL